jgi:hypothetical protein
MASKFIYWTSDGAGVGNNNGQAVAAELHKWILRRSTEVDVSLIVYGGDVYPHGKDRDFAEFHVEMQTNVSRMCETPGNHDWENVVNGIASGYERFWFTHQSLQPVDKTKVGGARYEHVIDENTNGWTLVFLDTGECGDLITAKNPWPAKDRDARKAWLQKVVSGAGRTKIIFAHHSRLSYGNHGDNDGLQEMWRDLFDPEGNPRVAFTLAGHDHNVSVYSPRPADDPKSARVAINRGVPIFVNGAGGAAFYTYHNGTLPNTSFEEVHKDDAYCITEIELIDQQNVAIKFLNFGNKPTSELGPAAPPIFDKTYRFEQG